MLDSFLKGLSSKNSSDVGSLSHLAKLSVSSGNNFREVMKSTDNISMLFFAKHHRKTLIKLIEKIFSLLKLPTDNMEIYKRNCAILRKELHGMDNADLINMWSGIETKLNIQINTDVDNILLDKMGFKIKHDNSISARVALTSAREEEYYKRIPNIIPQPYETSYLLKHYIKNGDTKKIKILLRKMTSLKIKEFLEKNGTPEMLKDNEELLILITKKISRLYRKKRLRSSISGILKILIPTNNDKLSFKLLNILKENFRSKKLFWEFVHILDKKMTTKYILSISKLLKLNDFELIMYQCRGHEINSSLVPLIGKRDNNIKNIIKKGWDKLPDILKNIYCFVYNDFDVKYDKTDIEKVSFFQFMKNPMNLIKGCFSKDLKYREICSDIVKGNTDVFSKLSIDSRINLSIPYKERLEKCRKEGFLRENLYDPNNHMRLHACKDLGFTPHHTNDSSYRIAFEAKKLHGFSKSDMDHPFTKIRMAALEQFNNIEKMLEDSNSDIVNRGKELRRNA